MTYALKDVIQVLACPRAWVARRIARLPDPKSPWAQFGIDAHEECESWLTQGRWIRSPESDEVVAAKTAVGWSGLAHGAAWGERNIPFELCGRTFEAHLDAMPQDWSAAYDWKFSNSRERWLTSETIAQDLASNWQAYAVMFATGRTALPYANVYVAPRNPSKAHPAQTTFTLDGCRSYLERIVPPALTMLDWFSEARPELLRVPHDPTACAGSRGRINCSFLGHCQHRPVAPPNPTLVQLRAAAGVIPAQH